MSEYQFEAESQPSGEPRGEVNWDGVEYGGFWVRVVVQIIDGIITSILFFWLLGMIVFGLDPLSPAGMGGASGALAQYILPAFYAVGFWIWIQATPGKMALGLVVVDANTGQPASTGKYIIRYIGYFISAFVLLLGFIWVAFSPRKQGWHDMIAGTVVVRKNSL